MGRSNGSGWTDTTENGVSAGSACRSIPRSEDGRRAEIRAHVTRHECRVTTKDRLPDTARHERAPRRCPTHRTIGGAFRLRRFVPSMSHAEGPRSGRTLGTRSAARKACSGVRRFWDRVTKHRPIWGKTAHPGSQRAAPPRHITTGQTYCLNSTLLEATSPPTRPWRTSSRGWTPHVPHVTDAIRPSQTSPALPEPVPDNAVAGRRHRHDQPEDVNATVVPNGTPARCQVPKSTDHRKKNAENM
jgi:hypothetical protein